MTSGHDDDHFEHEKHPSVDEPLGGPKRSTMSPLLLTVVVFAVIIALYLLGTAFLTD